MLRISVSLVQWYLLGESWKAPSDTRDCLYVSLFTGIELKAKSLLVLKSS